MNNEFWTGGQEKPNKALGWAATIFLVVVIGLMAITGVTGAAFQ